MRSIPRPRAIPAWLPPTMMLGAWVACGGGALTHIELDGKATTRVEKGTVVEALVDDLGFSEFTAINVVDDKRLANQGVEPGDITSVQLISFELEVTAPASGDLSFLDSFDVYVEAPGIEATKIAEYRDFADGQQVASFDVFDTDLKDYILSEEMTLTTDVTANRPSEDTVIKATYLLDVGVTLQGVRNQACN